jgi:hypothetical protein
MRALAFITLLTVASVTNEARDKRPLIPRLQDLATVWVGDGGVTSLEYYRLDLDTDGTGMLTVQYLPDVPARAYRVSRTNLSEYRVSFDVTPIDRSSDPLRLQGAATRVSLDLQVTIPGRDRTRRVGLQPYSKLLRRIEAVTSLAKELGRP